MYDLPITIMEQFVDTRDQHVSLTGKFKIQKLLLSLQMVEVVSGGLDLKSLDRLIGELKVVESTLEYEAERLRGKLYG